MNLHPRIYKSTMTAIAFFMCVEVSFAQTTPDTPGGGTRGGTLITGQHPFDNANAGGLADRSPGNLVGQGVAAQQAAAEFAGAPENRERAACFRFTLDLDSAGARWLERYVAWRTRALGLPYGDQGLLIEARFYRRLGGFPPIPIMEDVALVRRIGRARMTQLGIAAVTSGARYTRAGVVGRGLRNLSCLALYFLGVPPTLIARLYR